MVPSVISGMAESSWRFADVQERAERLYAGAIRNLTVIREVYATAPEAAEALFKLGELYTMQGKTAEADECYKDVLGVRDWRPLWPRALFGRGACAEKKGEWLKAAAYVARMMSAAREKPSVANALVACDY